MNNVTRKIILFGAVFLIALGAYFFLKSRINSQKQSILPEKEVEDVSLSQKEAQKIPEAGKGEPFSFAIIGDTQRFDPENSDGNFQKAVSEISKRNPSLVFAVGDLISSCGDINECSSKFQNWKKIMLPLLGKAYEVQGNHDRTGKEESDAAWRQEFNLPENGPDDFSELAYSFDFSNSHFVVLDSEKPKEHIINEKQQLWLEEDLSKNSKENTFVFFHEPAFPVSSKIGESLDAKKEDRDALWEILEKHQVTAVFNGHEHIQSRKEVDGIYQFVFGNTDSYDHNAPKSGLAEYYYQGSAFGLVEVDGKKITVRTVSADGLELNKFDFSNI